jgi:hypothetical protein
MGLRLGTLVDPEHTGDYAVELRWQREAAHSATVWLAAGRPVEGDRRLERTRNGAHRTGKLHTASGKVDIADGEAVVSRK